MNHVKCQDRKKYMNNKKDNIWRNLNKNKKKKNRNK